MKAPKDFLGTDKTSPNKQSEVAKSWWSCSLLSVMIRLVSLVVIYGYEYLRFQHVPTGYIRGSFEKL